MKALQKYLITAFFVIVAISAVLYKYWDYVANPWTRDGQIRAEVIQITPRISGPIIRLPIKDNQFVTAGELLFEIDPRTFQANLDQANAQYDKTKDDNLALQKQVEAAQAQVDSSRAIVKQAESSIDQLTSQIEKNQAEFERQKQLLPQKATSQKAVERAKANYEVSVEQQIGAVASLAQAVAGLLQSEASLAEAWANLGAAGDDNASIRSAKAAVVEAELNLEFTKVLAPVDGYITNLNLRYGSQTVANQAALALIDTSSYWVDGYFRENYIGDMSAGDEALVTLMSYPDAPIKGKVDSLGWGIAQQDGSTSFELLPSIAPTFEWIRLAQRIPVKIYLQDVPEHIALRVGTTASVIVFTNSRTSEQTQ